MEFCHSYLFVTFVVTFEKNDKDASKPVARHLISLTTPKNTWLSAAFPYI